MMNLKQKGHSRKVLKIKGPEKDKLYMLGKMVYVPTANNCTSRNSLASSDDEEENYRVCTKGINIRS